MNTILFIDEMNELVIFFICHFSANAKGRDLLDTSSKCIIIRFPISVRKC